MRKINLLSLVTLSLILTFSACHKDNSEETGGKFSDGIFVVNEGIFTTGTGTISFINRAYDSISYDIFASVNGRPLGNVAQSMAIYNGKAYIMVNNASKVEVVNAATFESEATITGLTSPRYFITASTSKGYVSDWAGNVAVIDLDANTVTKTIPVKSGPEQMLLSGSQVFVLNSGGWSTDSTISVINTTTDEVSTTIQVNHRPTGIAADKDGKIWVMCSGRGYNGWPQSDDSEGHLLRIDPATNQIDFEYSFVSTSLHPEKLVVNKNGDKLYFLYNGGIYNFDVTDTGADPIQLASRDNLYSLGYDKNDNYLYVSDPIDYQQDGWIYRYNASSGVMVDSLQAGIIPGNYCFGESPGSY
jgi:YVTN family beta-propeller protein